MKDSNLRKTIAGLMSVFWTAAIATRRIFRIGCPMVPTRGSAMEKKGCRGALLPLLEPPTGLEPALSAWKAEVLPLHHSDVWGQMWESNPRLKAYETCDLTVCPIYRLTINQRGL